MNGQHTQPAMLGEHDDWSAVYSANDLAAPARKRAESACIVHWYSSLTVLQVAWPISTRTQTPDVPLFGDGAGYECQYQSSHGACDAE